MALEGLFGGDADLLGERRYRLLLLGNVVAALGTALISPLLDTLTGVYGVSAANIGLMVTAVTAPPVVLIPLVGPLTDRVGRKPVLLVGLSLFGLGGCLLAATTDFRAVVALRLVQGIGFAGTVPVIITLIGDLYSGPREATGQGLRFAVSGVSQGVFPALAGIVAVVAWNYPFLIYGLALPAVVGLLLWFDEPSAGPSAGEGPHLDRRTYLRGLARLVRQPRVLFILLARFVVVAPFIAFLTYNSIVVVRLLDGSTFHAGLLVAIFSMVYAGAATQSGRITAAVESRALPLIAANAAIGVGLVLFVTAPSIPIAGVAATCLGVGVGLTFSLYRSIITGYAPSALRGGLVGLGESLGRLAASVTPIAVGLALAWLEPVLGTATSIRLTIGIVGAVGALVGALAILAITRSPPLNVVDPAGTD